MPSRPTLVVVALLTSFAACDRSDNRPAVVSSVGFSVGDPNNVYLDQTLRVAFDGEIDPASVDALSVEVLAVDGVGVGSEVRGERRVVGAIVEFVPELACCEPIADEGGLRPDTGYELRVRGSAAIGGLRARDGRRVASRTYAFRTRVGETAQQLFGGNAPGGPRLVDAVAAPLDAAGNWALGSAFAPARLRLRFDQPLDPAALAGVFSLRWNDPVYGSGSTVDVAATLLSNTSEGASVEVRPVGVLPSAAQVQLQVAAELRDLFGEDNVGTFLEPLRTFATDPDDQPRRDALRFAFAPDVLSATVDFAEAPAVVENGALTAPAFPSIDPDAGHWSPVAIDTVLRTDSETLRYQNGQQKTFSGGVLQMKSLHIPAGFSVRGFGPEPLRIIVDGDAVIEGTLSVAGTDGLAVRGAGQYRGPGDFNPPSPTPGEPWQQPTPVGAAAGAGGGRGGKAGELYSPMFGSAPGIGAASVPGGGGLGGQPTCAGEQASGGGGGGGSVQGDPWYPTPAGAPGSFPERGGTGGFGSMATAGGQPGEAWFGNGDDGDDFWGRAYVPFLGRHVIGELEAPRGGSGGGTGGSYTYVCPFAPGKLGAPGGEGGGGGGVLVLEVRGRLTVAASGRICADGGNGFGGAGVIFGSRGGGGGGAGGTVVLMAGGGIELHVRGETFADHDYDFCVSADGGIGFAPSSISSPVLPSKYPANGSPTWSAPAFGQQPLGGFGGMGLVQMMVPVGTDNADGTNTVLDDAIDLVQNGVQLVGIDKQRFLGWRGFPDDNGVLVDDFGMPTGTIGGQGDIRPDPVLLPCPFSSDGTARARSRWLSLGALHRRALAAPDGLPRGVVGDGLAFDAHAMPDGWLPHGEGQLSPLAAGVDLLAQPAVVVAHAVDDTTLAEPCLRVELQATLPDATPGAYVGCIASFAPAAGGSWTQRRVRFSTARTLYVDGELALPEMATRVRLLGWYVELAGSQPATVGNGGSALPQANARIGFAFHRAPAAARTEGVDGNRIPQQVGTFLYDLSEPATRAALRALGPRAVQWDVLLDGRWGTSGTGSQATPTSAIGLREFFLPVRY